MSHSARPSGIELNPPSTFEAPVEPASIADPALKEVEEEEQDDYEKESVRIAAMTRCQAIGYFFAHTDPNGTKLYCRASGETWRNLIGAYLLFYCAVFGFAIGLFAFESAWPLPTLWNLFTLFVLYVILVAAQVIVGMWERSKEEKAEADRRASEFSQ